MSDTLEMLTEDAPRVPDGSRPLIVGDDVKADLRPCVAKDELRCAIGRHARRCGEPLPAGCRELITPGEHFLLHNLHAAPPKHSMRRFAICAPCAVRDCSFWQVREADQ